MSMQWPRVLVGGSDFDGRASMTLATLFVDCEGDRLIKRRMDCEWPGGGVHSDVLWLTTPLGLCFAIDEGTGGLSSSHCSHLMFGEGCVRVLVQLPSLVRIRIRGCASTTATSFAFTSTSTTTSFAFASTSTTTSFAFTSTTASFASHICKLMQMGGEVVHHGTSTQEVLTPPIVNISTFEAFEPSPHPLDLCVFDNGLMTLPPHPRRRLHLESLTHVQLLRDVNPTEWHNLMQPNSTT